MAHGVTINRPDVVALRRLLDQEERSGSLFGAHAGSVRVREGVDLLGPALDVEPDAMTGFELNRSPATC